MGNGPFSMSLCNKFPEGFWAFFQNVGDPWISPKKTHGSQHVSVESHGPMTGISRSFGSVGPVGASQKRSGAPW